MWEYTIEEYCISDCAKELNAMGIKGWELIQMIPTAYGKGYYIFKRKLKKNSSANE